MAEFALRVCQRCARAIIAAVVAETHVKDIEAAPGAPEGEVRKNVTLAAAPLGRWAPIVAQRHCNVFPSFSFSPAKSMEGGGGAAERAAPLGRYPQNIFRFFFFFSFSACLLKAWNEIRDDDYSGTG